ncbi:MAG: ABC transporter permease [Nitriliruptorales bacterium]|nr:ABC transporter permease [Nitriliruptorales bacterium]
MSKWRRLLLVNLTAPVAALVFAFAVSSIALLISGNSPITAFARMWEFGTRLDSIVSMVNKAVPLYLSALAVAIGFKMGLFNIGVEGQYRLAAVVAAAAGAAVTLPAPLHILLIIAVAMAVGGVWSGIAGLLKVTRGVHEVISTIMLNFIAFNLGAYLFSNYFRERAEEGGAGVQIPKTPEIPESGRFPSLNPLVEAFGFELRPGLSLQGFVIIAIIVGILYWLVVNRTRFGFDLRASGINAPAAQASGVNAKRMVVRAMVLSGAVAGLVGLSPLLGFFYRYTLDFETGLGFTGIAVALLGRNHPAGMALGALLFGFLSRSSQILDLEGIPPEVVVIVQGVVVLSVVVAYEVVERMVRRQEARAASQVMGDQPQGPAPAEAAT